MGSWFADAETESLTSEHEYGRECARESAAQFMGRAQRALQLEEVDTHVQSVFC